jgi:hypothetical protein
MTAVFCGNGILFSCRRSRARVKHPGKEAAVLMTMSRSVCRDFDVWKVERPTNMDCGTMVWGFEGWSVGYRPSDASEK